MIIVEFLARFAGMVANCAASTRYVPEIGAETCTFRQSRTFRPNSPPAQADAFNIGTMIALLESAVGDAWDFGYVKLQICASRLIAIPRPASARKRSGDRMGVARQFPMEWLWRECAFPDAEPVASKTDARRLPSKLGKIIERLVHSGVPIAEIDTERLARTSGISPRMPRERLRTTGSNLRQFLDTAKQEQAGFPLGANGLSVSEAAKGMGYRDGAKLTRAFRRLSAKSPTALRRVASSVKRPRESKLKKRSSGRILQISEKSAMRSLPRF
jgi:AraC-like DNA-binding protein